MKTNLVSLLFLCLCASLQAQQSTLHGVVAIFNSKFETGKTEYVAYAQVEEAFQRGQPALTTTDGTFGLVLVKIKEKTGFDFTVVKTGFEVVNTDQLHAVAGQRDAVRIFMAPKGKIAANKRKFYDIGRTASEKALDQKIAAKQQEARALRADQATNRKKISEVEKEIADLYQRYQTIDQNARELAERFSHVNLDDASELYQRAFRYFQNGNIDSALVVLNEVNWPARVDSILAEEARLFALQNLIAYNDSVLTLRRDSIAEAIRVKIQSHLGLHQYGDALRSSEWLLQLYSQDTSSVLIETYRQASWLGLLAQEFSLAKLYAQTGLDLANQEDQTLKRSLACALFFQGETGQSRILFQSLRNTPSGAAELRAAALRELKQLEEAGLPPDSLANLRQMME